MDRHPFVSILAALVVLVTCLGCAAAPTATPRQQAQIEAATDAPAVAAATEEAPTDVPTPTPAATPTATDVPEKEKTRIRVFCAGSLMIPFAEMEAAFEAANPDIDMEMEAHGSIQVIRHVTDIHEEIDVVASADHALLSMLMYDTLNPDTGEPYARWNIRFARNRMAIAYDPEIVGNEITLDNWAEVLSVPRTRIGLSDPRFDACGYRQLMILQLAETFYGRKTLFEDILMGRFGQPIRAVADNDHVTIHVPEILEPRTNSTIVMRGSSIQLIPLLQSGDVDYIFEYESVSRQHGLAYVSLPDELSLGDPAYANDYGHVSVKLDFRRFASVDPTFVGEAIEYGVTVPTNAPNPDAAARFVAFLLGPEGHAIMAKNYHPLLDPATVDHPEELPDILEGLCVAE